MRWAFVDSWRADSPCLRMARSRNYPMLQKYFEHFGEKYWFRVRLEHATTIQKNRRSDSIVTNFYFTELAWRLLQHNLPPPTHAVQQTTFTGSNGSFDHLIGGKEQPGWHGQAERLRRFEVDDRFELGRRLHRKVGGLVSAQDAVDVGRRLPIDVDVVGPIGHETTGGDEQTLPVDRWQTVPGRERNDEIAVDLRTGIWRQEQAAVRCPRKCPDGALKIRGVLDQAGHKLDPERRRQGLRCTQVIIIIGRGLGVDHESGALETRRDLLEHREPLAADARLIQHHTGDIAARTRQARDKS